MNDLPAFLPNWSSTSLHSLPTTPDSWFFEPDAIPEYGGAGFCEDEASGNRMYPKSYSSRPPILCSNGINSALFFAAASRCPNDISSPGSSFNHNKLIFHPETRSVLCKSGKSSVALCCLEQVQRQEHPLSHSHQVRSFGSSSDEPVEFVRSYSLQHRDRRKRSPDLDVLDIQAHPSCNQILLNCGTSACLGSICSDGAAAEFKVLSWIQPPKFPKSADFAFLSASPFCGLEHEISAIVRSGVGSASPSRRNADYMLIFDCNSLCWRMTQKSDLTSETRCMYLSNDHPRQVLVADDQSFRMCDRRVSESASSLLIFSRQENPHLYPFEELMAGTHFYSKPHQHLLLSSMHVDLVDERFPGQSLIQFSHSLDWRSGTRFSRIQCQEVSFGDRAGDALVAVSNGHSVCLQCVTPVRGVVQPQLLHSVAHTFHLNELPGALSFSGCDSWESRMPRVRDLLVEGLDLVPSPTGFSLIAVTRNSDLFLQDFEARSEFEKRTGDSGELTSFSRQRNASLDLRTTEYLNYSLFNISKGKEEEESQKLSESAKRGLMNSSLKRPPECKHSSCKCCQGWNSSNSTASRAEPSPEHTEPQGSGQQSLFLDRLSKLNLLLERSADSTTDQTTGREHLPKWNLLSHNLLRPWSLCAEVTSPELVTAVVNQDERRTS